MPILNAVAGAVLVAFGLFLIGIAVVVFARPAVAKRFFMLFASSARTHHTEQVVRLIVGASLIIRSTTVGSSAMWQPRAFWFVGWTIVLSSVALILTPWQWHHRFGEKVRPMLIRRMKVYGVGLLGFGILIIYALLSGVFAGAA